MLPVKSNLLPTVSRFFEDDWNNLFDWTAKSGMGHNLGVPAVNIRENENGYFIEMAAPGLHKDKFKIDVEKNKLSISYRSEDSEADSKTTSEYVRREFAFSSFSRSFHLNKNVVDVDKIEARYENGILGIVIPKKEEAKEKPPRNIKIS